MDSILKKNYITCHNMTIIQNYLNNNYHNKISKTIIVLIDLSDLSD